MQFEGRRLLRQTSLYICLGILVLMVFVSAFSTYSMVKLMGEDASTAIMLASGLSPGDLMCGKGYLISAAGSSSLLMLFGIAAALYFCADYTGGTLKNIIGRGNSRSSVFLTNQAYVMVMGLIFGVICWLSGLFFGSLFWGLGKNWDVSAILRQLLLQMLVMWAFGAFYSFWSVLVRKTGWAVALCILTPGLISTMAALLDIFTTKKDFLVSNYWLTSCLTYASTPGAGAEDVSRSILVALAWFILFCLGGWLISRRQDV